MTIFDHLPSTDVKISLKLNDFSKHWRFKNNSWAVVSFDYLNSQTRSEYLFVYCYM